MKAKRCTILDRHKPIDVFPGKLEDFTLGPAEEVDAGVAAKLPWTLYCLDLDRREAVFVALPEGTDLSTAPFSGLAQFRLASEALVVPLEALDDLARAAPEPEALTFVYSMGRCGSTLLNALLNTADAMWSLSEPWAIEVVRNAVAFGREERVSLLRAVVRLLNRPPAGKPGTHLGVKLRSQTLFFAPALHEAFPEAHNIFLYREGLGWADSRYRTGQRLAGFVGDPPDMPRRLWRGLAGNVPSETLTRDFGIDPEHPTTGEMLAAAWATHLERYDELVAEGMRFFPLRYDELESDPERVLGKLFDLCDLSLPAKETLLAPFARDSQQGTSLERGAKAAPLDAGQIADFRTTLARHPVYKSPDWRVREAL